MLVGEKCIPGKITWHTYDSHLEAIIVVTPRTQRTKNDFNRAKKLWISTRMIRGVKQQGEHRVHSKQLQPTGQNPVVYTRVNRGGSKYALFPCRYIQLYIKLESIISSTVAGKTMHHRFSFESVVTCGFDRTPFV